MNRSNSFVLPALAALLGVVALPAHRAESQPLPAPRSGPTYADLADLADSAPLVARLQVRKLVAIDPARAAGVRPGRARFYVEARTEALLAGQAVLGEAQRYLVDLPLDAKGKPPKLKKTSVLVFARQVAGRPGELQLIRPEAQLVWDAAVDARVRTILAELLAPGAPPRVLRVREAIHVAGNLAGEGETQLFLATSDEEPAAITVTRTPGQPPRWGVSFSEVLAQSGDVPPRETLTWYRLACFLPARLSTAANVSGSGADRAAAAADYRFVLDQLGPCERTAS